MKSAIYEGIVLHHRRSPIDHRFAFRLALPLVFLDEMDEMCSLHPLWSNGRTNVVSYRRADYLGGEATGLDGAVREMVADRLGARPSGPIALLAHPRTWGWLSNPIALYYCFDPTGTRVEALVAEVTNTPWHERHAYVVGGPGAHHVDKVLHVSPFFNTDLRYVFSYRTPGSHLSVRIDAIGAGRRLFDAGLRLERRPVSPRELGRLIWSHPFMTMRVSAAIYRQALALWNARAPFVPHPRRERPWSSPSRRWPRRTRLERPNRAGPHCSSGPRGVARG